MALFLGQRRTATVTARRPSTLLRIGAAQFAEVLSAHPAVHQAVTRQLVTRLDRAQRHVAGSREPAIVAVLGAGSGASVDVRVREIASRLASTLRAAGHPASSCVMDPDLDASRLERAGELVLVAGMAADLGTARHWFDRVLLVVDGSARPEWVARLPRCGATDLVLVHPASTPVPTGSARLIDAAGVTEHHHLREDHPGDMARLARRLVGREHVLVLGGGGARGMAHLGTYRALVEAGIPIDVVAGVSAGALFAAAIALDWSPEQAVERSVEMLIDAGRLVDLTIPAVALSSGRRITEGIQRAFGADVDMEDLWRPMFCVAADLTTLTPSVLRTGRLWRAVRATVAVPGVFPPLVEGEAVLVDGGVIDNLPVERARPHVPGRRRDRLRRRSPPRAPAVRAARRRHRLRLAIGLAPPQPSRSHTRTGRSAVPVDRAWARRPRAAVAATSTSSTTWPSACSTSHGPVRPSRTGTGRPRRHWTTGTRRRCREALSRRRHARSRCRRS